ncbi:proline-rich nuclear receptor coactivator 2-like [Thomomys bottae]
MSGGKRSNLPDPPSGNVRENQPQLHRQKTRDQNSQLKSVPMRKERGHGYKSPAATRQAMQHGQKTKNFANNPGWNSDLRSPRLLLKSPPSPKYAGAKFTMMPSPTVLPMPPNHWVLCAGILPLRKQRLPN